MSQLSLPIAEAFEWFTGHDTAHLREIGTPRYQLMWRAPGDPEIRRGSPAFKAMRERWGGQPHLIVNKLDGSELAGSMVETLREMTIGTFHAICVKTFGLSGDVMANRDHVVFAWLDLVESGVLAHTEMCPVRWRLVEPAP